MKISIDAEDKAVGMDLKELSEAANTALTQLRTNSGNPDADGDEARITVIINFRGGIKTLQAEV